MLAPVAATRPTWLNAQRSNVSWLSAALGVFLLFASAGFYVRLAGVVFAAELILIAISIFLLLRKRIPPKILFTGILFLIYGSAVVVLDTFLHGANRSDTVAFAGAYLLFVPVFLAVGTIFFTSPRSIVWAFAGLAAAHAMMAFVTGFPLRGEGAGWYLGGGGAALRFAVLACAMLAMRKAPLVSAILLAVMAIVALMELDRSTGMIFFGLAVLVIFKHFFGKRAPSPASFRKTAIAVVVGVGAIAALNALSYQAASRGLLPTSVSQKIIVQWSHPDGYIVAARPDAYVAFVAALRRPFLGYGSSADDPEIRMLFVRTVSPTMDLRMDAYYRGGSGMPLHSGMAAAWVKGGLPGLMLYLYIIGLAALTFQATLFWRHPLSLALAYSVITLVYGALFEPSPPRLSHAVFLSIVILVWQHLPTRSNSLRQSFQMDGRFTGRPLLGRAR